MEIEAKFAITADLDPQQLDTLKLPNYMLRGAGVERHVDLLLDTPSRLVTGTLHALRIRTIGDRRVVTLKGPNAGSGGVHEREEIEAELSGPLSLDPNDWPREVGERALALIGGESLEVLLRLRVERRLWNVRRQGRIRIVGELALDTGEITAAGRHEPIHELELELKGSGARDDLDTLSAALSQALPLAPESRSKLERGLALLRHARWAFDGYTLVDTVVRHALRRHLRMLLVAQRQVIEQGADPDAIHDMRVATRRIRTTLQSAEGAGVFLDKRLESLRRRLSKVADELGAVRDVDIFLERIANWVSGDHERESSLESLRATLARRRFDEYEQLMARLHKGKYAKLIADLSTFTGLTPGTAKDAKESQQECILTRHFAGTALWPRYETILRYETMIDEAEPATLHRLRIACKRMRYVVELFAAPLGSEVTPMRKALVAAQTHLGDIQDLTVLIGVVAEAMESDRENAGLQAFHQALVAERQDLISSIDTIWNPLRSRSVREAFSRALAAL
ncbi:MAG TPA: CHAD domain-containing protein [Ktedonobacterales bacterium]